MISRRSLFKRLGAFAAVVALAPEIAFQRAIKLAAVEIDSEYACVMQTATPETTLYSHTWVTHFATKEPGMVVIENFHD